LCGPRRDRLRQDRKQIDHIDVPEQWTANVCFSGKDRKTLFITASKSFYSIQLIYKGAIRRNNLPHNSSRNCCRHSSDLVKWRAWPDPTNESKLIQQCLSGDPGSLCGAGEPASKMIRAVTFRMTGSPTNAEELAQDAFLRAISATRFIRRRSNFRTWLCPNRHQFEFGLAPSRKPPRRHPFKWAAEIFSENNPDGGFPDELSRRVQAALNRLPAKQARRHRADGL